MKKFVVILFLAIFVNQFAQAPAKKQYCRICICTKQLKDVQPLEKMLSDHQISFNRSDDCDFDNSTLYILCDAHQMTRLPKYFIIYETRDLTQMPLNENYLQKMSDAIAIWDCSKQNIAKYSSKISNYFYLPPNYEFSDPVLLPCFLPIDSLVSYRDMVIYSNRWNSDISSHLPTLFYYTITQKPSIIIEAGIRGAQSTHAFQKALDLYDGKMLGIDIDPACASLYPKTNNISFICMDDCKFDSYWKSEANSKSIDMIFIDTSHLYEHTLSEIKMFEPLLADNGLLLFHDSNVTPLFNGTTYVRLNGTSENVGPYNTRGVTRAIKEYFNFDFDESRYINCIFESRNRLWQITHYPFCNGLTVIKKLN